MVGSLPNHVLGQSGPENLVFRNLDEKLGLNNANITSIIRDRQGFMWYGTSYGLYRYDGTSAKAFLNSKDSTSISHNGVNKLFLGPNNNIWVKDVNSNFDVYESEKEKFRRGSSFYAEKYGLATDTIATITEDRQNRFWFSHPSKGISIYYPDEKKSVFLRHSQSKSDISTDQIVGISESPDGLIWVLHLDGTIDLLDPNRLIVTKSLHLPKELISANAKFEIFIDSDGDTWIFDSERDSGVFWINNVTHEIVLNTIDSGPFRINNNMVKAIIEAKPGEIWLGTDHGGINILNKKQNSITYLIDSKATTGDYSQNVVYALYKDNEDIIWIGTHKQGISYYHQGLLRFSHIQKNYSNTNSLPYNDVNAFVEDSLGNLYIGTNGGGLFYHNRKNNTYKNFKHDPKNPNSLNGDVIVDLLIDHSGVLWIGTYLNGLGSFDGRNFTNYSFNPDQETGIPGPNIWKLFEDSKNRIWIGTLRSGLSILDADRKSFQNFKAGDPPYYIHNQYITAFEEDANGNIWIGGGSGLNYVNPATRKIGFFDDRQRIPLQEPNISELVIDSEGQLWVATVSGLFYLNTQDSSFVKFGMEEGLQSPFLIEILEDDKQNFWISSQKGLSYAEVDRSQKPFKISFQNFDQQDGLQASLFNKNSATRTSNGDFIFGGPNGYNIFRSENFAFERNNPKVVFTELQIFNEPVSVDSEIGNRILLSKSLDQTKKLTLRHDEDMFSISFSALNYLYPEKNKYRYRLQGFNEDWIYLDENLSKVTFTNLDPGNYTLIVQPGTVLDGWSPFEYPLEIEILAPWWKTPIAYFFYFMAILAIILYSRNQLIRRQKENFERQQAILESKRIQELDKLKTKFFTNLSHEFRTPLSLILTPAEHLISDTKEPVLLSQYKIIQRNARRLLKLINQLLDVKNIDKGALAYHSSEGDFVQFIKESTADFNELSEDQHIALDFSSNVSSLQAEFDSDKIEKILFNLLSNAFKFTPEGGKISVILDIFQNSEEIATVELKVVDNGVGIPPENQKKIFDRFFTTEGHQEKLNQGSGIGLSLAQEFAQLMNGKIDVNSELGEGSTFIFTMPLQMIQTESEWEENFENDLEEGDEKETILLVEDNPEFRSYLKDCLSEEYHILQASQGKQGWDIAQEKIPDLVISDLMMPQMDGNELCELIKKDIRTSHIPVILLTAKKSEATMLQGLDNGCNLYLTKPFNLDVLLLSIKNLLRERKIAQEINRTKIQIKGTDVIIESLDDQLIQRAVNIVEKHLEDPKLSVEFLSSELAMSRVHLYKKLQSLTGKSPIEFIRLIRLQRAAQLLQKSQLTISEVAYQVGYNNAKYFSKHFKAEYKMLPSEYANKSEHISL
ncbi:response regulator [Algoriphagus aestuarii]|nr:response regulator [Algoriphagus aestuarii]